MIKELFLGLLAGPLGFAVFVVSVTISLVIDSSGTLCVFVIWVTVRSYREYMKIPRLSSGGFCLDIQCSSY